MYKYYQNVVGVDEVGRGPLAGPVVAAAVMLNPKNPINGLKDSKKLSDVMRRKLMLEIHSKALAYGIGEASVAEIDELNIHYASLLAMQRAVFVLQEKLSTIAIEYVIVDGKFCPAWSYPSEAIVGGDMSQPSISAASILAKVYRDNQMMHLDKIYPGYGFSRHKGYPTKMHKEALVSLGVTGVHRQSYKPVKLLLF